MARRAGAGLSPAASATGIVNVKRAPKPMPPLSARMRPPWASTRPLQIARPSPLPRPPFRSPAVVYLRISEQSEIRQGIVQALPVIHVVGERATASVGEVEHTDTDIQVGSAERRVVIQARPT